MELEKDIGTLAASSMYPQRREPIFVKLHYEIPSSGFSVVSWFFFLKKLILCVLIHTTWMPEGRNGCEPQGGCWDLNPGLLQEQQVLDTKVFLRFLSPDTLGLLKISHYTALIWGIWDWG